MPAGRNYVRWQPRHEVHIAEPASPSRRDRLQRGAARWCGSGSGLHRPRTHPALVLRSHRHLACAAAGRAGTPNPVPIPVPIPCRAIAQPARRGRCWDEGIPGIPCAPAVAGQGDRGEEGTSLGRAPRARGVSHPERGCSETAPRCPPRSSGKPCSAQPRLRFNI